MAEIKKPIYNLGSLGKDLKKNQSLLISEIRQFNNEINKLSRRKGNENLKDFKIDREQAKILMQDITNKRQLESFKKNVLNVTGDNVKRDEQGLSEYMETRYKYSQRKANIKLKQKRKKLIEYGRHEQSTEVLNYADIEEFDKLANAEHKKIVKKLERVEKSASKTINTMRALQWQENYLKAVKTKFNPLNYENIKSAVDELSADEFETWALNNPDLSNIPFFYTGLKENEHTNEVIASIFMYTDTFDYEEYEEIEE